MLRRHLPPGSESWTARSVPGLHSRTGFWVVTRRAPHVWRRHPEVLEQQARLLAAHQGGLYLQADQARARHLQDLEAADRWWKRQWQVRQPE